MNTDFTAYAPRMALLRAIVAALNGSVAKEPEKEHWNAYLDAAIPDGQITLSYRDGRVSVSPNWPRDRDGTTHNPQSYLQKGEIACESITVSASKTPEQIAKDIHRRFLPAFVPLWQKAIKMQQDTAAYDEAVARNLEALAYASGGFVRHHGGRNGVMLLDRLPQGVSIAHGGTDVYPKSVNLELSLPIEDACEILRMLRAASDAALLEALEAGDGAALFWQLPAPWDDYSRIKRAVARGVCRLDPDCSDLVAHPEAERISSDDGTGYNPAGYSMDAAKAHRAEMRATLDAFLAKDDDDTPDDDKLSDVEKGSHIDPNDIINSREPQQ